MLNFLSQNKPSPIGLDIGHESIKMLQLAMIGHRLTAVASARWQFPDNVAGDAALRRRFAVDAVRELLNSGGFRGRQVITCLGSEEMTIKQVRMPRMSDRELQSALQWEANERFGYKLEPDQLNYAVAGEVRQGADVCDEVILMGARKETIDDHLAMLEEMKLYPMAIDAEPICLFRSFERFLRRRKDVTCVTVLVDIGISATRVIIARGRQVAFIKSIGVGGRQFNQVVSEWLNLSIDEAAQLRMRLMRGGEAPETTSNATTGEQIRQAVYDAMRSTVEELAREIALCLRYYAVTFRGAKADIVTLAGGEVYDPCLRELLNEYLNIQCQAGQPLKGMDLSLVDLGADRRGMLSEWAIAAGLALRNTQTNLHAQERANEPDRLSA